MEIWCECFGKDRANLRRADSYELAGILARIEGWTRKETKCNVTLYGPQWVFIPSGHSKNIPSDEVGLGIIPSVKTPLGTNLE